MNYGKRIRSLRKQRKLSAEKLGQLIGLSQSMVSKLENGERNLDIDVLESICSALNISLIEFFIDTQDIVYPFLYEKQFEDEMDSYINGIIKVLTEKQKNGTITREEKEIGKKITSMFYQFNSFSLLAHGDRVELVDFLFSEVEIPYPKLTPKIPVPDLSGSYIRNKDVDEFSPELQRIIDKLEKLPSEKLKILESVLNTWFD